MTSNVSKKTSYLVVGEEAGESKLAKVCSQPRCASSVSLLGCPICTHVLACIWSQLLLFILVIFCWFWLVFVE